MKYKVWKFPFENVQSRNVFNMPRGAKILSVHVQDSLPVLWALVDPEAPKVWRVIQVAWTGEPIEFPEGQFIGTVQVEALVLHFFDLMEE